MGRGVKTTEDKRPLPFLKWAGGKRWLTEQHTALFDVEFDRFVEPFLGSGAVFFHLSPAKSLMSDSNPQLIEAYEAIRDDAGKVRSHLVRHQRNHCKDYYYRIRNSRPRSAFGRAAKLIYLNRTCWNGLYRVNLIVEFNVLIGTNTNVLLDTDDFDSIAVLLSRAELRACDFEDTLSDTGAGDFVFVDPPYTVKHNVNGFIKYNEGLFSWDDQVRLRSCVVAARERGAKVLVTNANHRSLRHLYKGVGKRLRIARLSVISGKQKGRGVFEEMVVKCF